jgi:hypothetical protein
MWLPYGKLFGDHLTEGYLVATKLKSLVVRDVKVSISHWIETYVVAIKICFLVFFLCPFFLLVFPPCQFSFF